MKNPNQTNQPRKTTKLGDPANPAPVPTRSSETHPTPATPSAPPDQEPNAAHSSEGTSPQLLSPAPNQKSETINQKSITSLPELAALSSEQLDYIHEILRTKTYAETQEEIWSFLGCRISTNRLQRYREKLDLAAALEIAAEDTLPAADQLTQLQNLLAGRETTIPEAGLLLVQQRALALAASPKTSATLLKDLFRIFTYQDRRADNAHRRQLAAQRELARQQAAADRRAHQQHREQMDHHYARLAEQREQTRERLADLAVRKFEDAVSRLPKPFNQEETTKDVEAIIAYGRNLLREQAEKKAGTTRVPPVESPAPSDSFPTPDTPSTDPFQAPSTPEAPNHSPEITSQE